MCQIWHICLLIFRMFSAKIRFYWECILYMLARQCVLYMLARRRSIWKQEWDNGLINSELVTIWSAYIFWAALETSFGNDLFACLFVFHSLISLTQTEQQTILFSTLGHRFREMIAKKLIIFSTRSVKNFFIVMFNKDFMSYIITSGPYLSGAYL